VPEARLTAYEVTYTVCISAAPREASQTPNPLPDRREGGHLEARNRCYADTAVLRQSSYADWIIIVRRKRGAARSMYEARFPVGSMVKIASLAVLQGFTRPEWTLHHPLDTEQLSHAGAVAVVEAVGYYHGCDILYELEGFTGVWHEACLGAVDGGA
jgi:hypothetical protein